MYNETFKNKLASSLWDVQLGVIGFICKPAKDDSLLANHVEGVSQPGTGRVPQGR